MGKIHSIGDSSGIFFLVYWLFWVLHLCYVRLNTSVIIIMDSFWQTVNPFSRSKPQLAEAELSPEEVIDNAYERHLAPSGEVVPSTSSELVSPTDGERSEPRHLHDQPLHSTTLHDLEHEQIPSTDEHVRFASSEPLHPAAGYDRESSRQEVDNNPNNSTENLLRALVNQFTEAIKAGQQGESVTAAPHGTAVKLKPPHFDGKSDVHLFIKQFMEVSKLSGWDDKVALVQLRGCLDKGARDHGSADTLQGVFSRLLAAYGLTPSKARELLHCLKKEPGESYFALGNRVERLTRLAYGGLGLQTESQMALEHFDRALPDPALRQHLLVVRAGSLEKAVQAAEQYDLVAQSSGVKPRNQPRVAKVENSSAVGHNTTVAESAASMSEIRELFGAMSAKLDVQAQVIKEQGERLSKLESSWTSSSRARRSKNDGRCYECGSSEHFRRDCPQRKAKSSQADPPKPPDSSEN